MRMGMTQGLLATMIAHAAPTDLCRTAYGFFDLVSKLAMLLACVLAGLLWHCLRGISLAINHELKYRAASSVIRFVHQRA